MGSAFLEVLYALDISVGGMAIEVPHGFSEDDLSENVDLIITMPGSRSFRVKGQIRHISVGEESGKFGVEFAGLAATQRLHLEWYVAKLTRLGRGI